MREIRTSGSEGGGTEPNRFSLPLSWRVNAPRCVLKDSSDVMSFRTRPRGGDRGRENRLGSVPPPSEPDVRISRLRLSSWWCHL